MENQDSPTFSADQRWKIPDLSLCATLSRIFGVKDGVVIIIIIIIIIIYVFFTYLHIGPFNSFTLRPRYDTWYEIFCCSNFEIFGRIPMA